MHSVTPEFLQKVIGFAEATNSLIKASEDQKAAITKVASAAVNALVKAGYAKDQKPESLAAGFANQPALAVELVQKLAEDIVQLKTASKTEVASTVGAAAESENATQRSKETHASKSAAVAGKKESDLVWERGFGGLR